MKRKKEVRRLRVLDKKSYYTKEELDAMDIFKELVFMLNNKIQK